MPCNGLIAFSANTGRRYQLYPADPNGHHLQQITYLLMFVQHRFGVCCLARLHGRLTTGLGPILGPWSHVSWDVPTVRLPVNRVSHRIAEDVEPGHR